MMFAKWWFVSKPNVSSILSNSTVRKNFTFFLLIYFKEFYLFLFLERGEREGEIEGGKRWCKKETLISCLLNAPWLGTEPDNQCMCPDWELNQWIEPKVELNHFHFVGQRPTNWATLVRSPHLFYSFLCSCQCGLVGFNSIQGFT